MTDKEHKFEPVSISAEEVWKSLEEQDKTGVYKRAREMADLTVEQLEYAYNSGYKTAKAKYSRPQGRWIENLDSRNDEMQASCYCSECGASCYYATDKFCHECGADMRKGSVE